MKYIQLARALLERGDAPQSVETFLSVEYGLNPEQAHATLRWARRHIKEDERAARHPRAQRGPVAIAETD